MDYITQKNSFFYPLLLLLFFWCVGVAVQYIPNEPINTNIKKVCNVFKKENYHPVFSGRIADNYTDAVMFMIAASKSENAGYKRFLDMPVYSVLRLRTIGNNLAPIESLCHKNEPLYKVSYARYWHGYQIFLRPLLYFTDYEHIRNVNLYLQVGLFVVMLWLMYVQKTYGLMLGWVVSYIILNPEAMGVNITYSIAYYIAVITSILIFTLKEKIEKYITWPVFFLMVGMSISFFDFLTYPVVTIGIPLTILFYIDTQQNAKTMFKNLVLYVLCWGIGYIGMWILKWSLCALLSDADIIGDALLAVDVRLNTSPIIGHQPFYSALLVTLNELLIPFDCRLVVLIALLASIVWLLCNIKQCLTYIRNKYYRVLPFFLISLGSPIYCLLVRSHPLQHAYYTYRLWIVFFFAIISGINFWVLEARKEAKNAK